LGLCDAIGIPNSYSYFLSVHCFLLEGEAALSFLPFNLISFEEYFLIAALVLQFFYSVFRSYLLPK